jgi:hypothetical protein
MFVVATKKESDEESSSCPDGSFVGDHEYHLREEVVSIMEKITPTNPETDTANPIQVDHPDAQALLEAQADYQTKTKGLLETYYKAVDEIRDNTTKVDLPFPDVLTEQQKAEIILSQKAEEGEKLYQRTVTHYERAVEQFSQQAQKHTAKLRSDLFGVGEGGSAALSQAVGANEEQLVKMIELGELTGDPTLARAAFSAGVVRGDAPQAVRRYLDSNPETEACCASTSRRRKRTGSRRPSRT